MKTRICFHNLFFPIPKCIKQRGQWNLNTTYVRVVEGSACSKLSNTDSHLLGSIPGKKCLKECELLRNRRFNLVVVAANNEAPYHSQCHPLQTKESCFCFSWKISWNDFHVA